MSLAQDSLTNYHYHSSFFLHDLKNKNNREIIDSSFNQIANYSERNLIGNLGTPDYNFVLGYNSTSDLGINWFTSPYQHKTFFANERDYYGRKGIYTNLFGAAGSRNEQCLKFTHIQNINDDLNFSLQLNRFGSNGFYEFQQSFVNNVRLSSDYINKKRRFGYYGNIAYDRFKHQENGGITSDTAIIADPTIDKSLVSVYLSKAKRNYSLLSGDATVFFKLNKDSTLTGHYLQINPKASLSKSQYHDDPSAGYYNQILLDSISTNDSVLFGKFSPYISYNANLKNISFELGSLYDWSYWKTPDTEYFYNSYLLNERIAWNGASGNTLLKQTASYVTSGENSGDYKAEIIITQKINFLSSRVNLRGGVENRSPDLFFRYNSVNNYYWKNTFEKTKKLNGEFSFKSEKLKLGVNLYGESVAKMIVLANTSLPMQLNETVNAFRFNINHHLKLWRFHITNDINYQSSDSYAYALPELYTKHQLYYEHLVKKNGLKLQIGVQANYISAINPISYNPALNSYYLLYDTKTSGNYIFADVFLNIKFKQTKFFFKADHLNQGFTGNNYTLLQNYYQPDRAFKFGINWEFWD